MVVTLKGSLVLGPSKEMATACIYLQRYEGQLMEAFNVSFKELLKRKGI